MASISMLPKRSANKAIYQKMSFEYPFILTHLLPVYTVLIPKLFKIIAGVSEILLSLPYIK
ncbi:hypothetical protein CBS1_08645 [Fervidobacterium changbaicum]|uniref:Uncharacterized protein n=1 Tax=Fervidobacterium changbaicum TaxID=310769 RepID=A0AAE6CEC1_9BACT|nr:hypothetical protein CBS1_08645 [Fervidobacterium changbaicum]